MERQPDHKLPDDAAGSATMPQPASMKSRWQAWVRAHVWKMDIHHSARIAETALIDRTFPKGVHIAENCVVDHEAVLLTHDLTRGLYLDTRIGAGSYLGPRSIILPGITIGKNCRVSAGALVNRDMPDHSIAGGNPAEIKVKSQTGTVAA